MTSDEHSSLIELTKQTNDAIEEFKARHTAELKDLRKELHGFELRQNRLGLSGVLSSSQNADLVAEHKALSAFVTKGDKSALLEMKGMQVGSDPAGGYLVLPAVSDQMTRKIFDQSPMKGLARVVTIDSGDSWEEVIDADEPDAEWVGETQSRNETGSPDIGKLSVLLNEIHASPRVSQKMLDASYFDVGTWLEQKVADKFGRTEGVAFIRGNGVGQPRGILSKTIVSTGDATRAWGALQYIPTGVASALTDGTHLAGDSLTDTVYALRSPYRNGATWLMNSTTAGVIRKFKDSTGQFLWQSSLVAGQPSTLLGYPVAIDENMDDVGANKYPVAFGNFKLGYVVVELKGFTILRDPYTAKPNIVFYCRKRVGGDVSNSEAIKLLKVATS